MEHGASWNWKIVLSTLDQVISCYPERKSIMEYSTQVRRLVMISEAKRKQSVGSLASIAVALKVHIRSTCYARAIAAACYQV